MNIFKHISTSKSIFTLIELLDGGEDPTKMLELLCQVSKKPKSSTVRHTTTYLASVAIYMSIIFRYKPNTNLYLDGRHFCIVMLDLFSPYLNLFMSYIFPKYIIQKVDLKAKSLLDEDEMVIDFIKNRFNMTSPEYSLLKRMKSCLDKPTTFFLSQFEIPITEQAIFLDRSDLIVELEVSDIMRAIYLHSNSVLKLCDKLKPEYFERSIECINETMAKISFGSTDVITQECFADLISENIDHPNAKIENMIRMCLMKNINLCKHIVRKIPLCYLNTFKEVYFSPRWTMLEKFPEHDHTAMMKYYEICISAGQITKSNLISKMRIISSCIDTAEKESYYIRLMSDLNKTFYITSNTSYIDFFQEGDSKLEFANEHNLLLDDIFQIPKEFVVSYRTNNTIFFFTIESFNTLLDNGLNPYTKCSLPENTITDISRKLERFTTRGLKLSSVCLIDLINEILRGRRIEKDCGGCKENYKKKLAKLLNVYSITEEMVDNIHFKDMKLKLSMVGLDYDANNLDELCKMLCKSLLISDEEGKSELSDIFSSLIHIYSK